ncbi:MAG: hypothetical protein GXC78_11210 [Chitinophagaceae bacterium]|nr:hypothetical protein [Chitinophagaceae bacterium]
MKRILIAAVMLLAALCSCSKDKHSNGDKTVVVRPTLADMPPDSTGVNDGEDDDRKVIIKP